MVSGLTYKSLIHLEFMSLCGVKECSNFGNSLAVQWLGLLTFTAACLSLFPGRGNKVLQAMQCVCVGGGGSGEF